MQSGAVFFHREAQLGQIRIHGPSTAAEASDDAGSFGA